MKIIFLLFAGCFCLSANLYAQEWVFDPQHFSSVVANASVRSSAEATHSQYLGSINNHVENINTDVGAVVLAQTIIYNGLANVSSALKDGLAVKNMAVITADMIGHLDQCLDLAKQQPYLLLFASGIENEMQTRAVALVNDVSGYVLKEGDNILADYNARDQLLRKIVQQLQILDSLAYGAWRTMYWANQRGIIASINPYQSWINKDKNFVNQIISNAKYLQK
jgi:hypothetical protein